MSRNAYRKLLRMMDGKTRDVIIVTGAPGSGKSTFVKNEAASSDLVVDLDEICKAITGKGNSTHSDFSAVLPVALKIRDALYAAIENQEGDWEKAYIISATPKRQTVQELLRKFGGKEHRIQATREECFARIRSDESRKDRQEEYIRLANEWFDSPDNQPESSE